MTFRTPLTSAVDTGAGQPAGVRIYQSTDGRGNPQGVIELDDGVAGDAPSTITVTSFGGLGGGSLAIKTGSFGGVTGPELDLYVDQGSGKATTALTTPGGFLINGLDIAPGQPRQWYAPRSAFTSNATDALTSGATTFILGATISGAPAGDYALVTNPCLAAGTGSPVNTKLRVLVNNVNVSNDMRVDRIANPSPAVFGYGFTWPGGDLPISVYVIPSAAGTIFTAGSGLLITYLGPRS